MAAGTMAPHLATEADVTLWDFDAAIKAAINAAPGVVAISATIRYEDGRIERFTVHRPAAPVLTRVK